MPTVAPDQNRLFTTFLKIDPNSKLRPIENAEVKSVGRSKRPRKMSSSLSPSREMNS
jgi:hypothetical protein